MWVKENQKGENGEENGQNGGEIDLKISAKFKEITKWRRNFFYKIGKINKQNRGEKFKIDLKTKKKIWKVKGNNQEKNVEIVNDRKINKKKRNKFV